jgi:diguanylate cyclase (GGDEF)-like protein
VDAERILDLLRPAVLVVDATGTIREHRGAHGGVHGYAAGELVGTNVFDLVPPDEVDELASYFLGAAGRSAATLELPMPFRLSMIGTDGEAHAVDIIPTGSGSGEDMLWIAVVVPDDLHTAVWRSLEAEMAGAPRDEVKRLLTEELLVENTNYSSRWFLVDLSVPSGPTVTTGRAEDQPMADAIAAHVGRGWRPWGRAEPGAVAPLATDELPAPVSELAAGNRWRRVLVTPVHVDGALVAAYLRFSRVPDDDEVTRVDPNVAQRIRRLADATALLVARWHDRDRLVAAATRDPLTGLANRDAFADALSSADDGSTVLYVDVDRFKTVNDRLGHDVGDRVLVEIGRRIAAACRPSDVVARFGGDEFVVLLLGADATQARAIAGRVEAVVAEPMPDLDEATQVTVSVGLAPVTGEDAVSTADQAMLEAKRAGRARVVGAGDAG